MKERGRWLRWWWGVGLLLSLGACVLAVPPSLDGWLCDDDSDCLYGSKCCARSSEPTVKRCQQICKECEVNETRKCYESGKEAFAGKGVCKYGQEACTADGSWSGLCQKATYPSKELCNGKDDDCNGKVDDGIGKCECTSVGEKRPCFAGDKKQIDVGICKAGVQECLSGFAWGECKGEIPAVKEECNGKDDDCNGEVDDKLTKECTGTCGKGTEECKGGNWTVCSAEPSPEVCDGKDNNCDGKIDNIAGSSEPLQRTCFSGPAGAKDVGICKSGLEKCRSGAWSACEGEVLPLRKDCTNNKDNNCDGTVDTDCSCPKSCNGNVDCDVTGCGERRLCNNGACVALCVSSCLDDSDCAAPGCGPLNRCVNSVCSSLVCPTQCSADLHCKVDSCQTKRSCQNGACVEPPCPSQCTSNADCALGACAGKNRCHNQRCVEPCKADSRLGQSCMGGFGICATAGKWVCSGDGKAVVCDGTPDNSKKQPKDICKNGLDDNCDGVVDDGCGSTTQGWITTINSTGSEQINGLALDGSGNVYVTGFFQNTITLGGALVSKGSFDIFVVKLDPSGKLLWAKSLGGTGNDNVYGIAVDGKGDVVVVGAYYSTITEGARQITSKGDRDIFVAKYTTTGVLSWLVSAGGLGPDEGKKIACDTTGNCFLTGSFQSTATFGSTSLSATGGSDVFIARISPTGSWGWAIKGGTAGTDEGLGIGLDSNGNVYVSGLARDGATFGSLTVAQTLGTFHARLSQSTGSVTWLYKGAAHLGMDANGNSFMTGTFWGTLQYGLRSITSVGSGQTGADILSVKLNSSGTYEWAFQAGGAGLESGSAMAVDSSGNVFLAGSFTTTPMSLGGRTLSSRGGKDILVSRQDKNGNFNWAISAGSTADDFAIDVKTDSLGNVYVVGGYQGALTISGAPPVPYRGGRDAFLWKIPKP